MARIRDRVTERIARKIRTREMNALGYTEFKQEDGTEEGLDLELAKAILAIPELAIVDRKAKLPSLNHNWIPLGTEMSLDDIFDGGQRMAQETMLGMGWVKEVANEPETN